MKVPSAPYFLLAFSFFIMGITVFLSERLSLLPSNEFTQYAMQYGTAMEATLFSFALANRINLLQAENASKQRLLIEQMQENEQMHRDWTASLESRVELQTRKLQANNRQLAEQNHELAVINAISRDLVRQLSPQAIVELLGNRLYAHYDKVNVIDIVLLESEQQWLRTAYRIEQGVRTDVAPRPIAKDFASYIVKTKKPLFVPSQYRQKFAELDIQSPETTGARQTPSVPPPESQFWLGVPLQTGDQLLGAISLQSGAENALTDSDLRLLGTLAANVSVALTNSSLFEQAQAAREFAEQAAQAKTEFLNSVSHELRTPLTSILGFAKISAQALRRSVFPKVATGDPRTERAVRHVNENLDIIKVEGERLTKLINDVLDLAKIEAGRVDGQMQPIRFEVVVERARAATAALFEQKPIELTCEVEPICPPSSRTATG